MPATLPGLFICWRLESGLRYRNMLKIADFESVRTGDFSWRHVKEVHETETYVPEITSFPFAGTQASALKALKGPNSIVPS